MSSSQDSVRQLSIKRWLALSLGLFLCLTFALIINFAVSGMKHSIRYRAELQGEVASREELENAVKQYEAEKQQIQKDLQDVHRMSEMVRRVLGIKGQGLLGQVVAVSVPKKKVSMNLPVRYLKCNQLQHQSPLI